MREASALTSAFARALVRGGDVAEDLVGDAFHRLVREVDADRQPDNVRGWLYRAEALPALLADQSSQLRPPTFWVHDQVSNQAVLDHQCLGGDGDAATGRYEPGGSIQLNHHNVLIRQQTLGDCDEEARDVVRPDQRAEGCPRLPHRNRSTGLHPAPG